jgi:hypothetical protein
VRGENHGQPGQKRPREKEAEEEGNRAGGQPATNGDGLETGRAATTAARDKRRRKNLAQSKLPISFSWSRFQQRQGGNFSPANGFTPLEEVSRDDRMVAVLTPARSKS